MKKPGMPDTVKGFAYVTENSPNPGGHLGFPIGTILAVLNLLQTVLAICDLQVTPTKFRAD